MRHHGHALSLALAIMGSMCLGASLGSSATAAEPETPWTPILRQALATERNCTLTEVLYFRELKLGNDLSLEGRVRCVDGREFEFSRARPHMKFTFALCQPAVC